MKLLLPTLVALGLSAPVLAADPDYATIRMEIDVAKPAAEVWAKVGKYCDISEWLGLECKITSGDGGIGTVVEVDRSMARKVEPRIARACRRRGSGARRRGRGGFRFRHRSR